MLDIEIQKVEFSTSKTARVLVIGEPAKSENIWVCLHGYSQQISGFANALKSLNTPGNAVIIPEALHRFYIKGSSGDVGASWMTKEEREADIRDNIYYLDELYKRFDLANKKVSVLGFSQGAATAVRWVCRGEIKIDKLVLWAGVIPPDLNLESDLPKLCLVVGTKDEYLGTAELQKISDHLHQLELSFEIIQFEGGHTLKSTVLKQLALQDNNNL
jgi:predicted esterase